MILFKDFLQVSAFNMYIIVYTGDDPYNVVCEGMAKDLYLNYCFEGAKVVGMFIEDDSLYVNIKQ